jgi:hypothetical protein
MKQLFLTTYYAKDLDLSSVHDKRNSKFLFAAEGIENVAAGTAK